MKETVGVAMKKSSASCTFKVFFRAHIIVWNSLFALMVTSVIFYFTVDWSNFFGTAGGMFLAFIIDEDDISRKELKYD